MKTTFAVLMLCALSLYGQAQTSLMLTNDIPIWRTRINFGLQSYSIMATSTNDEEAFQRQGLTLFADEKNCEVFHQATNYQFGYSVRLIRGTTLQMEIKTTNGIPVPKSAQGKVYFKEPEPSLKIKNSTVYGVINGAMDLPRLDALFAFPTNGEYVLEARCWYDNYDDGAKPRVALSDPVRVKVIVRNIATNALPQK